MASCHRNYAANLPAATGILCGPGAVPHIPRTESVVSGAKKPINPASPSARSMPNRCPSDHGSVHSHTTGINRARALFQNAPPETRSATTAATAPPSVDQSPAFPGSTASARASAHGPSPPPAPPRTRRTPAGPKTAPIPASAAAGTPPPRSKNSTADPTAARPAACAHSPPYATFLRSAGNLPPRPRRQIRIDLAQQGLVSDPPSAPAPAFPV